MGCSMSPRFELKSQLLWGSCQRFKSPVAGDATTKYYKAFCVKLTFDDEAFIAGEYTFELAEEKLTQILSASPDSVSHTDFAKLKRWSRR
eukprot:s7894_g4.t1